MKSIERKITPQERYNKKNVKQVKFNFNIRTDADIIEQLEKQPNKQGYIKQLIRNDIKK